MMPGAAAQVRGTRLPPLSVVIPAYNEEERLPPTLRAVAGYLEEKGEEFELLVVNDGSGDRTVQVVEALARELRRVRLLGWTENRGKGFATRAGVLAARYPYVLLTDADLSTPIEEVERLFVLMSDADVVIATRSRPDARVEVAQHPGRMLLGKIFNRLVRVLGLASMPDTQCGFKLWRTTAARQVFHRQRIERFAFDVEVLFLARRLGMCIREVGVVWRNHSDSRVRLCRDAAGMLFDLFRIRFTSLRGVFPQRGDERAQEEP